MTQPEKIPSQKNRPAADPTGVTPHDLVERQLRDPGFHMSEEDIEKMQISGTLTEKDKAASQEEADAFDKDSTGTSYDVLG